MDQSGKTGYGGTPADGWEDVYDEPRPSHGGWLMTLPVHIWGELIKGVFLSAAVFSVILMAVFAGQVMRDGIGPLTLMKVLPNFLPLICPFVLPLAIITGIIICYSRLAKDNEILASYAGGIHPFWLALPALLTSILAIFVTLTLNEVAIMPAINNIESLVIEDQANILRRMISRPGSLTVMTGNEHLAMDKMDPAFDPQGLSPLNITRFAVSDRSATDTGEAGIWDPRYPYPTKRIMARDHHFQDFADSSGGGGLVLKMTVVKPVVQDLHGTDINRSFIAESESGEERIALGGRTKVTINSNRSSFWPILMLSESRRDAEQKLAELTEEAKVKMKSLPEAQQASLQKMWEQQRHIFHERTAEINMRLALCFSCLAFAILGIPLGMRSRGTLVTSFVVGIVTAGIYFLALKSGEIQVTRGYMPYWVIWVPDALVILLGCILWRMNSDRG